MKNIVPIAITILTVGCGGKDESTTETKAVEEKVQEVKEEAETEEPVAETKPKPEGVNHNELKERGEYPDIIQYLKGSDTPYTGKAFDLHPNGELSSVYTYKNGKQHGLLVGWHTNGQKQVEGNFKEGKADGLMVGWHENGKKHVEGNFKDGELISEKYWNSKGEPVATAEESRK